MPASLLPEPHKSAEGRLHVSTSPTIDIQHPFVGLDCLACSANTLKSFLGNTRTPHTASDVMLEKRNVHNMI